MSDVVDTIFFRFIYTCTSFFELGLAQHQLGLNEVKSFEPVINRNFFLENFNSLHNKYAPKQNYYG